MAPASLDRCHESNTRASSRDAPYLPPKLSSKQQSRLNKCPVCSEQALKRSTGHECVLLPNSVVSMLKLSCSFSIDLSCWMSRMPNEISLSSYVPCPLLAFFFPSSHSLTCLSYKQLVDPWYTRICVLLRHHLDLPNLPTFCTAPSRRALL